MKTKRLSFWLAVAGVSLLANFGVELLRDKVPAAGLDKFVGYAHRGPSRGE